MEDRLIVKFFSSNMGIELEVLILVLMEDRLIAQISELVGVGIGGLNPCFNGR